MIFMVIRKTTTREIKSSVGRFLAILAIVALGVGFFSGLKVCRKAMLITGDDYLSEHAFYDYRLLSTLGFTEEDVTAFTDISGVESAEGSFSGDFLFSGGTDASDYVLKVHAITEYINRLSVTAGRMPENDRECVVDMRAFPEEAIGTELVLSDENKEDSLSSLRNRTFTIVGLVNSPYYLNFERGTTSLGTGTVRGFVYLPSGNFDSDYFTEVFLTLKETGMIYSDAYDDTISEMEAILTEACEERTDMRYQKILSDANAELDEAKQKYEAGLEEYTNSKKDAEQKLADTFASLDSGKAELESSLRKLNEQEAELTDQKTDLSQQLAALEALAGTPETEAAKAQIQAGLQQIEQGLYGIEAGRTQIAEKQAELEKGYSDYESAKAEADAEFQKAEQELTEGQKEIEKAEADIAAIEAPDCYVLTRSSNVGYVCFENDSNIVEGISNVFPVFFFLVAALVCITTMTRMVDEQRTQIGVLKALGYSRHRIMSKYMVYSGSAALTGCVIGFAVGTFIFPRVIWEAYDIMYGFAEIQYIFNVPLAVISVLVSLLCSMGATWLSCRHELSHVPAELIRPKAPKNGKRILLERVPFIWKRLKFLYKVSIRNVFRYKKRFFMMLLGIGGCTALLLTGFGIKDSIKNVAGDQFDKIMLYDYSVSFSSPQDAAAEQNFRTAYADALSDCLFVHESAIDLDIDGTVKSAYLVVSKTSEIGAFVDLHNENTPVAFPEKGEAVINSKLAEIFDLSPGDTITVRDDGLKEMKLTISGIFDNYVYNYLFVSADSCEEQWGYIPAFKTAYANAAENTDSHESAAQIMSWEGVINVSVNDDTKERVVNMMSSLDYIILLITVCAGALALIVLYNLTNINITERIREIATIKVLGFYPGESASYVFRENIILTVFGAGAGLLLGKWLHAFVMSQINIDLVSFDVKIMPSSYIFSILLTFGFACLVNLAMYFKLQRINMAESLKSIE